MAGSDGLRKVALAEAHVPAALALSAEAGWNQNAADWRLMIRHGDAIGLEDAAGCLVASALALPYPDGGFGWISMVLVTRAWQRRGLATRLMHACIESLRGRGLTPALDATPAGAQVYAPLGFRPAFGILRLHAARHRLPPAGGSEPLLASDLDAVAHRDHAAFGADRRFILADMAARAPALARRAGAGHAFARDGRTAWQLGPLVAERLDEAKALAAGMPLPALVDVPEAQAGFLAWLADAGFTVQRPYTRMVYGRSGPFGDPARVFALAGPELG